MASPDTLAIDIISSLIVSDIDTPRNLDVRSTAITTLLAVMESRDETDITEKILLRMRKENLVNMIQKLRNEAITLGDNPDTTEKVFVVVVIQSYPLLGDHLNTHTQETPLNRDTG